MKTPNSFQIHVSIKFTHFPSNALSTKYVVSIPTLAKYYISIKLHYL